MMKRVQLLFDLWLFLLEYFSNVTIWRSPFTFNMFCFSRSANKCSYSMIKFRVILTCIESNWFLLSCRNILFISELFDVFNIYTTFYIYVFKAWGFVNSLECLFIFIFSSLSTDHERMSSTYFWEELWTFFI